MTQAFLPFNYNFLMFAGRIKDEKSHNVGYNGVKSVVKDNEIVVNFFNEVFMKCRLAQQASWSKPFGHYNMTLWRRSDLLCIKCGI